MQQHVVTKVAQTSSAQLYVQPSTRALDASFAQLALPPDAALPEDGSSVAVFTRGYSCHTQLRMMFCSQAVVHCVQHAVPQVWLDFTKRPAPGGEA